MHISVYYVLPNILLFGSMFLVMSYIENASQKFIDNHNGIRDKFYNLISGNK